LNHLPVVWRTQYALAHTLVPESPRAILLDLKNIKKLFTEKSNEAAQANWLRKEAHLKEAKRWRFHSDGLSDGRNV